MWVVAGNKYKRKTRSGLTLLLQEVTEHEDPSFWSLWLSDRFFPHITHRHRHTHTNTRTHCKYCACSTNSHIKAHNHPIPRLLQVQNLRQFISRAFQMLQATKVSGLFYFLPLNSVEKSFSPPPYLPEIEVCDSIRSSKMWTVVFLLFNWPGT